MHKNLFEKRSSSRKLLMEDVRFIRRMDQSGEMGRKALADKYNMNPEVIARICRGETYREVEMVQIEALGINEVKKLSESAEEKLQAGREMAVERLLRVCVTPPWKKLANRALSGDRDEALKAAFPETVPQATGMSASLIQKNQEEAEQFVQDSGGAALEKFCNDVVRERKGMI